MRRGVCRRAIHATAIVNEIPSTKPSSGESTMAAAVLRKPLAINVSTPPFATAAPDNPPISAWDELDGMP